MTERAFHTVWLPLQGRFYRVAFYLLEDEADAKDAVQELYLKLWTLRDHLELIREPAAYGSLLMKNLCIDRIRKRKPREALREDQADDPPPDRLLELREELKDVLGKMDALPPNQRKLLGMRVLQGLSYDQISQQTGLSPLNIRVQISLARKKIKA
ncbi:MAG: RNA polymerase sigma factor [Candidatus Cryptobacteroides sp.]|jgi:RNA polymerase sigma-70 factor (ECF subfamily)|nr:RNA polymerase sigma factor [Candidatus Cryptobacteroides sp.]